MSAIKMEICNEYFDSKAISDSGQCFRWYIQEDGSVAFLYGRCAVFVVQKDFYTVYAYEKGVSAKKIEEKLVRYFDLDRDYGEIISSIRPDDKVLLKAADEGRGLRILNQDLWEIIVSFIISQNNNIPRIKKSIYKLCEKYGEEVDIKGLKDFVEKDLGKDSFSWPLELNKTFPTPQMLEGKILDDLGLGYRDKYIEELVCSVLSGEVKIDEFKIPAEDELMKIKGIGKKVAACIELFGLHDLGAFPRDTWVKKIEEKYYNGRFEENFYKGTAGIMQQDLFCYERSLKK